MHENQNATTIVIKHIAAEIWSMATHEILRNESGIDPIVSADL
jgi:hypothetical protein